MNNRNHHFTLICCLLLGMVSQVVAQQRSVTLAQCRQWVEQGYPLLKQKEIYSALAAANDAVLKKNTLPQVTASAQGTYQSEVTEFDLPDGFPSVFPEMRPDQYRIGLEVRHTVLDFGYLGAQRQLELAKSETQLAQVDVDMHKVKERVNQLYGNILLLKENRKVVALRKNDLLNRRKKVASAVENGASLRTNLLVLESEVLTSDQRTDELNADLSSLVKALSLLTGQPLDTAMTFEVPQPVAAGTTVSRPELGLFALRKSALAQQTKLLDVSQKPRVFWFGQGFFGRPGYNFLNQDFRPYGIIGVGAEWQLSSYYSLDKKRQMVTLNSALVQNQQELFDLTLQTELAQKESEIVKYEALIARDQEILKTKSSIRSASESQLENGIITSSDYLTELDAENAAQLNLGIHRIQLAMAKENYQTTLGQ